MVQAAVDIKGEERHTASLGDFNCAVVVVDWPPQGPG